MSHKTSNGSTVKGFRTKKEAVNLTAEEYIDSWKHYHPIGELLITIHVSEIYKKSDGAQRNRYNSITHYTVPYEFDDKDDQEEIGLGVSNALEEDIAKLLHDRYKAYGICDCPRLYENPTP